MAKNMIYKYTENKTRVRVLAATVQPGTPLLDPADARPAVSLTASGDATKTITTADIPIGGGVTSSITYKNGGVSLTGKETTLAYDGTWEFAVTGVVAGGSPTANGAAVYITSGGVLTLTSTSNTLYGHIDYPTDYYKRAAIAPVRIGAV